MIRKAKPKAVDYDRLARRYIARLTKLKTEDGDLFRNLREIVEHQDQVRWDRKMDILVLLGDISEMAAKAAGALRPHAKRNTSPPPPLKCGKLHLKEAT